MKQSNSKSNQNSVKLATNLSNDQIINHLNIASFLLVYLHVTCHSSFPLSLLFYDATPHPQ
jgi:hypothetical protein